MSRLTQQSDLESDNAKFTISAQPAIVNSLTKILISRLKLRDVRSENLIFRASCTEGYTAGQYQPKFQCNQANQRRDPQPEPRKQSWGKRSRQINDQHTGLVHPKPRDLMAVRVKRGRDSGVRRAHQRQPFLYGA
jgi:hypothetical protein